MHALSYTAPRTASATMSPSHAAGDAPPVHSRSRVEGGADCNGHSMSVIRSDQPWWTIQRSAEGGPCGHPAQSSMRLANSRTWNQTCAACSAQCDPSQAIGSAVGSAITQSLRRRESSRKARFVLRFRSLCKRASTRRPGRQLLDGRWWASVASWPLSVWNLSHLSMMRLLCEGSGLYAHTRSTRCYASLPTVYSVPYSFPAV